MAWTVETIAARRATGDALVTAGGWSVSFDTTTAFDGTCDGTRLSAKRYDGTTSKLILIESDPRDGELFADTAEAEAYALNAGRLQWFRDTPAGHGR